MQKRDVTWTASAKVVPDLLQSAAFVKPEWKFSRKMVGRASSSSSFFYYVYNPNQCLTFEAVQKFDEKSWIEEDGLSTGWKIPLQKCYMLWYMSLFVGVLNITFRSVWNDGYYIKDSFWLMFEGDKQQAWSAHSTATVSWKVTGIIAEEGDVIYIPDGWWRSIWPPSEGKQETSEDLGVLEGLAKKLNINILSSTPPPNRWSGASYAYS